MTGKTSTTKSSSSSSIHIKPSMAWLFLFFPALGYYMTTRLHSMGLFRSSTYGTIIGSNISGISCSTSSNKGRNNNNNNDDSLLVYVNKDCTQLKYPVYLVDEGFDDIVATTWKHDEELGRGYLLISTSSEQGKVWQWETGGGPIAIGRTLHLQDSGCRSSSYRNCTKSSEGTLLGSGSGSGSGSGGLVVDTWHEPPRLIVAEWGEGRIARLEENGARTPLVIQIPETPLVNGLNETEYVTRVQNPYKLLFTPLGDLMFLDTFGEEDRLFRLPQAATGTPPLESLAASRRAHSWNKVDSSSQIPLLMLRSTHLGGIALEPNQWLQMYVTMKQNNSIVVVRLSLEDDEDDGITGQHHRQSTIVLDYSMYTSMPRAIEVDEKGNLYLIVDDGVLMATSSGIILGKISISEDSIVDLTLGEDKFLYMATQTKLIRTRVKNGPLIFPTDLLLKA